ncbi:hypothetical protein [Ovoidimarina sediminis]|uniref:hypothetical protein n=1 Tax=Ovoidimarina sediminis TaxID=3079856 RepID=UPI00290F63AA|nr:hypothetical protein [Rhodophyticola sp. MJ-SS7]MDU8944331.1 hypothetical protein [Rhodophyticola sp. MJ-SS7]
MLPALVVTENDETLSFDFDDLVRYHGKRSICGLTVAYKVMEAAWDTAWTGTPPERDRLVVASGFPGPGARDGFEMVTRAVTRGAYEILSEVMAGPRVAEAAKGAYFFRLSDDRNIIELGLKPEVVPPEFVTRRRKLARGVASAAEAAEFRALQLAFSDQLRAMSASDAINVLEHREVPT